MKTKNDISFVRVIFCLALASALVFSTGTSLCQNSQSLKFDDCKNYEDSCLLIGNKFIKNLSEQEFDKLARLFSGDVFFRALIPSCLETSDKPSEVVKTFQKWFYVEAPAKYEMLDSKTDVMVDCLHIYYKIFRTYEGVPYNVEQHLYCELGAGKIQKLSLICSGFRKVDN